MKTLKIIQTEYLNLGLHSKSFFCFYNMDPTKTVSYDDVEKIVKNQEPKKMIIDVREPSEIQETGQIPSSINIPLSQVDSILSMSNEEFQRNFNRSKPSDTDEIIFYCRSGTRASEAYGKALRLGYKNSKSYLGSWQEWSSKN